MKLTIILRGPQGSGKTRVAQMLNAILPLTHIKFEIIEEQT